MANRYLMNFYELYHTMNNAGLEHIPVPPLYDPPKANVQEKDSSYALKPLSFKDMMRYATPEGWEPEPVTIQDMDVTAQNRADLERIPDSFEVGVRNDFEDDEN